jgi:DNA-binding Lrp family transcriptional regulator
MTINFYAKIRKRLRRLRCPEMIRSFDQDQQREGAFDTLDRGHQVIPLDRIVGSVGRYSDFDGKFRPRQQIASERYQSIKEALREGRRLPPVKLYQIKDQFYVLDGNHRIAAAKELGHSEIHAHIVEFIPSEDILENLIYRQRADFSKKTGLPYAITLTEVGQYEVLLQQIVNHREHLQKSGPQVTFEAAADDWYTTIYRPLVAIIRKGDLIKHFPRRTLDDLYAYVSYHQWEIGRERKYGIGVDRLIPSSMEAFREKMADINRSDYPEMLQEITVFVLLNVRSKNENRLLQKLFALKEVREVHSIHGNVDVLAKIVLTRDLLSSDAQIISEFVANQIRSLPGVVSSQTLIPGQSMIKGKDEDQQ